MNDSPELWIHVGDGPDIGSTYSAGSPSSVSHSSFRAARTSGTEARLSSLCRRDVLFSSHECGIGFVATEYRSSGASGSQMESEVPPGVPAQNTPSILNRGRTPSILANAVRFRDPRSSRGITFRVPNSENTAHETFFRTTVPFGSGSILCGRLVQISDTNAIADGDYSTSLAVFMLSPGIRSMSNENGSTPTFVGFSSTINVNSFSPVLAETLAR